MQALTTFCNYSTLVPAAYLGYKGNFLLSASALASVLTSLYSRWKGDFDQKTKPVGQLFDTTTVLYGLHALLLSNQLNTESLYGSMSFLLVNALNNFLPDEPAVKLNYSFLRALFYCTLTASLHPSRLTV